MSSTIFASPYVRRGTFRRLEAEFDVISKADQQGLSLGAMRSTDVAFSMKKTCLCQVRFEIFEAEQFVAPSVEVSLIFL